MQVFKGFFKILKKNLSVVIIYFIVFSVLMLIFGATLKKDNPSYVEEKVNAYIVCHDESASTKEILNYLEDFVERKDLQNLSIEDALFWGEIDIYIEFQDDFFERLLKEEENILTVQSTPENQSAYSIEARITSLLNQIKVTYRYGLASKDKIVSKAVETLTMSKDTVEGSLPDTSSNSITSYLFGYGFYVMFAVIITLTGTIMMAFKSKEIKRRMNISSVSSFKLNVSLIGGNLCLALVFSLLIFALSYFFIGPSVIGDRAYLYLINYIVLSVTLVCISYAIALAINSPIALNVMSVVLPLGTAFLSGLFVPQEVLSKGVLGFAHILPQYYAVCCNQYISSARQIQAAEYFGYMWPHLIFISVSILCIAILYKRDSVKEV